MKAKLAPPKSKKLPKLHECEVCHEKYVGDRCPRTHRAPKVTTFDDTTKVKLPKASKEVASGPVINGLMLLPTRGLDQPRPSRDFESVLKVVDARMNAAITDHDPAAAFAFIQELDQAGKLAGIGLAKSLYMARDQWHTLTSKTFVDRDEQYADFQKEAFLIFGKAADTVRRYCLTWEMYDKHQAKLPAPAKQAMQQRPMGDQIAVAQYVAEHGALSDKQWEQVTHATDTKELRAQLRELQGTPAPDTSQRLALVLKLDGTLVAYEGDSKPVVVGLLRSKQADLKDPIRAKAIVRLCRAAGIRED